MGAGRPPKGFGHVDGLEGTGEEKHRLRVILETLLGVRSIEDACYELGIGESRFHDLRRMALDGALDALKPGCAGRPRNDRADPDQMEALQRTISALEWELRMERSRTEVGRIVGNERLGDPDALLKKGVVPAKVWRRSRKKARH